MKGSRHMRAPQHLDGRLPELSCAVLGSATRRLATHHQPQVCRLSRVARLAAAAAAAAAAGGGAEPPNPAHGNATPRGPLAPAPRRPRLSLACRVADDAAPQVSPPAASRARLAASTASRPGRPVSHSRRSAQKSHLRMNMRQSASPRSGQRFKRSGQPAPGALVAKSSPLPPPSLPNTPPCLLGRGCVFGSNGGARRV